MWKIKPKQRDATLWQAIKNEFEPIYNKTNGKMKEFLETHPEIIYVLMIMMIITSSITAVVIYQRQPRTGIPTMQMQQSPQEINNNINELQEIQLKQAEIDYWTEIIAEIIKKESISLQDSMLVEQAIKELEILNKN